MSLDINICSYKRAECPHCGGVVKGERNVDIMTGGWDLRDMLNLIRYGDDQYGRYVELTTDEINAVARCLFNDNRIQEFDDLQHAIYSGDIIELEADW